MAANVALIAAKGAETVTAPCHCCWPNFRGGDAVGHVRRQASRCRANRERGGDVARARQVRVRKGQAADAVEVPTFNSWVNEVAVTSSGPTTVNVKACASDSPLAVSLA